MPNAYDFTCPSITAHEPCPDGLANCSANHIANRIADENFASSAQSCAHSDCAHSRSITACSFPDGLGNCIANFSANFITNRIASGPAFTLVEIMLFQQCPRAGEGQGSRTHGST